MGFLKTGYFGEERVELICILKKVGITYEPKSSETYQSSGSAVTSLRESSIMPKAFFDSVNSKTFPLVKSGSSKESRTQRTQISYRLRVGQQLLFVGCRRSNSLNFQPESHWSLTLKPSLANFGFFESEESK